MRLNTAIPGYLLYFKGENSARTAENYAHNLGVLSDFLGNPELSDITPEQLNKFIDYLKTEYQAKRWGQITAHPAAPSTVDNYWKCTRSFFRWAKLNLGLPRPDLEMARPKYETPEIIPFSREQLTQILDACESTIVTPKNRKAYKITRVTGKRDTAVVSFLLDTGLRLGELCRLKIEDINLDNGEVLIIPFGTGKKTKSRIVYIGMDTRRAVWQWLATRGDYKTDEYLFPSDKQIHSFMVRMSAKLKIPNIHAHRFRHTFAIEYLKNGGDVFTLKRLLGHASLKMVEHYLRIAKEDVANAHRAASPVDRLRSKFTKNRK